jgi:hypothetical protein
MLVAPPQSGAAASVSGKLSKRGYTVLAFTERGKVASAKAKKGAFKVRAPGSVVALHLLDRRGRYAGPIVMGTASGGRKAVLGVKAGAKLGLVELHSGYARPARKPPARMVSRSIVAKAKRGVPIGSRGFGLVRGAKASSAVGAPATVSAGRVSASAGSDGDGDGVPAALDIDANGNGVIDAVDPSAPRPSGFGVFSQLVLSLDETVNAAASGVTQEMIDDAMKSRLTLVFLNVADGTELDCNGLTYCSLGGTGRIQKPPEEGGGGEAFPSCCDSDGDGAGDISGGGQGPSGREFRLEPRAGASDIRSGDTMTQLVGSKRLLGSLGFVFNTVPAAKQLTDGAGATTAFSYPVAAGGVGTQANPIVLPSATPGPLSFVVWRPQRRPITGAGEPRKPIDVGGLDYQIQLPNVPGAPGPSPGSAPQCPQSSFTTSDPSLTVTGGTIGAVRDSRADAPVDPAQTISFSLDLAGCIAARGGSVTPGANFHLHIEAVSQNANSVDHADQVIYFRFS